jgi:hypothetical protein
MSKSTKIQISQIKNLINEEVELFNFSNLDEKSKKNYIIESAVKLFEELDSLTLIKQPGSLVNAEKLLQRSLTSPTTLLSDLKKYFRDILSQGNIQDNLRNIIGALKVVSELLMFMDPRRSIKILVDMNKIIQVIKSNRIMPESEVDPRVLNNIRSRIEYLLKQLPASVKDVFIEKQL